MKLPPAMKGSECDDAITSYRRSGDKRIRDRVVAGCMKFVDTRVRRFTAPARYDELMQAGAIGLWTAIDKWERTRGASFMTYAKWWVDAEIRTALRESASTVSVPRRPMHLARVAYEAGHRSPREIASVTGLNFDVVTALMPLMSARDAMFVDGLGGSKGEDERCDPETAHAVRVAVEALPDRDREIIERVFWNDERKADIAALQGVGRARIGQIERRALERLRRQLREVA